MKYPPPHYQNDDKHLMLEVIRTFPLATVISVENNLPIISHLPLIYNSEEKLIGHIDIFNPQAKLLSDNKPATIIFYGPQSYISPSLFKRKQLPTYNYIRVHLTGTVAAIDSKEALKQSLINMTTFLEHPHQKFKLEANNPSMEHNLNYIKMFEITITSWEGKFKLSQDKTKEDTDIALSQLIKQNKQKISVFYLKLIHRKQ